MTYMLSQSREVDHQPRFFSDIIIHNWMYNQSTHGNLVVISKKRTRERFKYKLSELASDKYVMFDHVIFSNTCIFSYNILSIDEDRQWLAGTCKFHYISPQVSSDKASINSSRLSLKTSVILMTATAASHVKWLIYSLTFPNYRYLPFLKL